ncbi:BON domain-containing protein [Alienimonas californiensis]|uniref:LysM domain/BON superfamily protein n=1 Tax=Alienimonas californiensis TaxID=2527989 RepID=A0A517P4L2_9PLAN|nr:BON domain-containing protein [Alienimonas californiensis]QDT14309.1 LysM domain/BON superfamily protein [Alienimonas californiensis]
MRTHRKAGRKAAETYMKWVAALGIAAAAPCAAPAFADGPADPAAQSAAAADANQQTADAVAQALRGSGLRGSGVEIVVREGACRLTGTVETAAMKQLASEAASVIPGVTSVENAMRVSSPSPAIQPVIQDARVTPVGATTDAAPVSNQAVAQQIAIAVQQAGLAGYDMEIRFKDGTCTLDGQVADSGQIAAAVAAARNVPGVGNVANRLTVGEPAAAVRTASAPAGPAGPPSREEIAYRRAMMQQRAMMQGQIPPGAYPNGIQPASSQMMAPGGPGCPPGANPAGPPAMGPGAVYNQAALPDYAWPTYAQHPNYAGVTYPKDYSASAWPYIGPFYPYPQVPLGWREVELEWDDGQWYLDFHDRTDRWWWFMNPENW